MFHYRSLVRRAKQPNKQCNKRLKSPHLDPTEIPLIALVVDAKQTTLFHSHSSALMRAQNPLCTHLATSTAGARALNRWPPGRALNSSVSGANCGHRDICFLLLLPNNSAGLLHRVVSARPRRLMRVGRPARRNSFAPFVSAMQIQSSQSLFDIPFGMQ